MGNDANIKLEIQSNTIINRILFIFVKIIKKPPKKLNSQKYEVIWEIDSKFPNGHYFIVLKINDLQVYLKLVRQKYIFAVKLKYLWNNVVLNIEKIKNHPFGWFVY